jgi:hypothetical protein
MLAIQAKAFSLLLVALLIVDALAFQGRYRDEVGGRILSFASAISPTHWTGMGGGRDWSTPGQPRPRR